MFWSVLPASTPFNLFYGSADLFSVPTVSFLLSSLKNSSSNILLKGRYFWVVFDYVVPGLLLDYPVGGFDFIVPELGAFARVPESILESDSLKYCSLGEATVSVGKLTLRSSLFWKIFRSVSYCLFAVLLVICFIYLVGLLPFRFPSKLFSVNSFIWSTPWKVAAPFHCPTFILLPITPSLITCV